VTYALIFLSGLMAVVVWWLVRQTVNVKPWNAQHASEMASGDGALSQPSVKVGLGVFLAVATSLFALLISAYHMRMMGEDWVRLSIPKVLWLNTAVLILASVAMQWTRGAARREQLDQVKTGMIAAGAFSFAFLAGQLWAWQQMVAAGYFLAANPAYSFFFLLTAVHGIHLLGGLCVWARTTRRVMRGGAEPGPIRLSVELCTVYWHYLLVVWVVLFAVLLQAHD
jgi:cytochrome c oxidase subunit 3